VFGNTAYFQCYGVEDAYQNNGYESQVEHLVNKNWAIKEKSALGDLFQGKSVTEAITNIFNGHLLQYLTGYNRSYCKLKGLWVNGSGLGDICENYFIVKEINGVEVTSTQAHTELTGICEQVSPSEGKRYEKGIKCFASATSFGYEYAILTSR
jgi:hypothetical protein